MKLRNLATVLASAAAAVAVAAAASPAPPGPQLSIAIPRPPHPATRACPAISARLGLHWPYYAGPHAVYPENSAGAVDAAHAAGVRRVETDATFSKDGVPMALHDATVNRVTGHTGKAASYTAATLESWPLRMEGRGTASSWMSTQHVRSLRQILTRAQADGLTVSVEVKPTSLAYTQARAILRAFWAAGDESTVDVRSYTPAVLAEMRTAGYWGRLTLIVTGIQALPAGSYWMESVYFAGSWPGAPVPAPVPPDAIAALQAEGIRVDGYTPDTAAGLTAMPLALDQVTTDNVHAAVAWERTACG